MERYAMVLGVLVKAESEPEALEKLKKLALNDPELTEDIEIVEWGRDL